jgi:hypothetical protein
LLRIPALAKIELAGAVGREPIDLICKLHRPAAEGHSSMGSRRFLDADPGMEMKEEFNEV